MIIHAPCRNCEDRKEECHRFCRRYADYKRTVDKNRKELQKFKATENDYIGLMVKGVNRSKNKKR